MPSDPMQELIEAAKTLACAPGCYYDGNRIVIECDNHADAIRRMRVLRSALSNAETHLPTLREATPK